MVDTLDREIDAPAGMPNCPTPQYQNDQTDVWERIKGRLSAAFAMIKGANGNLVNVNADGSLPVTVAALPAGDNNIGNVDIASSIPEGDNNIGNVDLASAIPAGNNVIGQVKLTDGTHMADINADGTLDVYVGNWPSTYAATQSGAWNISTLTSITNVVHVDDNSSTLSIDDGNGSITVDGSVNVGNWPSTYAATQSGTWNIGTVSSITNPVAVTDNGGSLTVDGSVSLAAAIPTGSNNIGKIVLTDGTHDVDVNADGTLDVSVGNWPSTYAVTQSGAWNIGTLTSITNVVHVDDNNASLTVDGTVAATQSGSWSVDVATLPGVTVAAGDNTIGKVKIVGPDGYEATVDGMGNLNTSIMSPLPSGSNAIGNIGYVTEISTPVAVTDNGDSLTIDGSVSLAEALPAGSNTIGSVNVTKRQATATPTASTVSVTTNATALPASPLAGRHTVWITNPSTTVSVYLTDGSGNIALELFPQDKIPMPVEDENVLLYAKVSSGSQNVYVMELK